MQQLLMRRADLAALPDLPTLPPGYALREGGEADLSGLADLLGMAFDDNEWTEAKAQKALFADATVKRVYVIEHEGVPVATASVRLLPEAYPGSGYVHWVGAHPDHRRLGLGYIVSLATLHDFVAHGCRDAVLETDDFRLPAIRTYLKLGFAPVDRDETHPARWEKIMAQLRPESITSGEAV
jgi:mycothiol synthase